MKLRKNKIKRQVYHAKIKAPSKSERSLDRAVVIPLRINKGKSKSKRGIFVLIFGQDCIIDQENIVVIWNEGISFDWLPYTRRLLDTKSVGGARGLLGDKGLKSLIKEIKMYSANLEATPFRARTIQGSVELVRVILEDQRKLPSGRPFPKSSIDSRLRDRYLKERPLSELMYAQDIHIGYLAGLLKHTHIVFLDDLDNSNGKIKTNLVPDPYSVLKSFMEFIGVYPIRQGGNSKRVRHTDEDKAEILNLLKEKHKNSSPSIKEMRQVICEYDSSIILSDHALKQYRSKLSRP